MPPPLTVLTVPLSVGAGVLPVQDSDPLIELADTVTEMKMVKHHYKAGVPAQRGIED